MVKAAKLAVILTFIVIVLGAYTRLVDAGLGCPDWPGCYGLLGAPTSEQAQAEATLRYPERPVEVAKAWTEMVHRYVAGALGLLVFGMAAVACVRRGENKIPKGLPLFLAALITFQALLGMWTVTLKLHPTIVMLHLLGGMATLALLTWLWLRERARQLSQEASTFPSASSLRKFAVLGLIVLVVQIALGGWTSANYAALACLEFPQCHGQWWPSMALREAFSFWLPIGPDYEGGEISYLAKIAVQMVHRVGAVITLLVLVTLVLSVFARARVAVPAVARPLQRNALAILFVVLLQFLLGMLNIWWLLPLPIAVAHNGVAALLLFYVVKLNFNLSRAV